MTLTRLRTISGPLRPAVGIALALLVTTLCLAQTPTANPPEGVRGVLRLRVRIKLGDRTTGLSRKRFYLIKGSADQHKNLIQTLEQRSLISRDCYYRAAGASEALVKWLKDNDCESVYCREIATKDIEGPDAVPEFRQALAVGERAWDSAELARKWLTVNLPEQLRLGFYRARQHELQELIQQAEMSSGSKLATVMTDTKGFAYFADVEPGIYVISNLLPIEVGSNSISWNGCQVELKPEELSREKRYQISNTRDDRQTRCVGVEKPLPPCESGSEF
ncbi:MAG TPA: hypothetical protein VMM84_15690 [Pyrinomonadaceae bacterium]|nr:hypothetical protein [Pyrinomonadaceae bacterium]